MEIEIKKLLLDYDPTHSKFKLNNFIIGSAGDAWAQYKQALREIDGRYENLKDLKEQKAIAESACKIMMLFNPFSKYSKMKNEFKKRMKKKAVERISCDIENVQKELEICLKLAQQLKEQIGEVTDERRQQLELESWTANGRKMVAIDQVLMGRPSQQTFEFVLSLPRESQDSILDKILPDDLQTKLLIESLKDE